MDSLKEDILSNSLSKPLVWWCYIDDIFMMWKHGQEELQKFLETLNCYRPTTKFTVEYFKAKMHFWDVDVRKKGNKLVTDLYVKPTKYINIFMLVRVTFPNTKNKYHLVKPCVLTECVLKTPFLINDIIQVMAERKRLQ